MRPRRPLGPDEQAHDCGFCGAGAGEYCRSESGSVYRESHQSRVNKWYAAGVESGGIRVATVRLVSGEDPWDT